MQGGATHVDHSLGQVDGSLADFTAEQVGGLVIAYEPVWAIGTGEVATPEDARRSARRSAPGSPTPAEEAADAYAFSTAAR